MLSGLSWVRRSKGEPGWFMPKQESSPGAPPSTGTASPPRVVMTVFNTFQHDTRVYKQCRSLLEWGCEVDVVCIHKGDLPREETQDGIRVHRVSPSPFALVRLLLFLVYWPSTALMRRLLNRKPPQPAAVVAGPGRLRRIIRWILWPISAPYRGFRWLVSKRPRRWPSWTAPEAWPRGLAWIAVIIRWCGWYLLYRPTVLSLRRFRLARRGFRRWRVRNRLTMRHARKFGRRLILKLFHPAIIVNLAGLDLARKAISLRPTLILSHDLNTLLAGVIVKRMCEVPLVYDSHELYLERNIGNRSRSIDRFFWSRVERRCMKRVDLAFSVAQGICDWLAERYDHPDVRLIRNVQPFEPPSTPSERWQRELGIPEGTPIGIYAGAITINRGIEQLIDSAAHLKHMAYVIMGYAFQEAYLEGLTTRARELGVLNERVFFKDAVPMDQVIAVVASARVSVVPTQNVCLSYFFEASNKIFHSLMAGVPVAMSDHAEKRMIADNYKVGVLFDETDPAGIARAVEGFVMDEDVHAKAAANCLEAAKELNWEHEEFRYRQAMKGLLGDGVGPVPPVQFSTKEAAN
ncbi:MAG: hypothetical protein CMH55_06635 [Myxococcales bacterium]|nr:hypothetical protein [Myxococcales bacterium]